MEKIARGNDTKKMPSYFYIHPYMQNPILSALPYIAFVILFIIFTNVAFSLGRPSDGLERTYSVGGSSGWEDISVKNGVVMAPGRYGMPSIILDTSGKKMNNDTDMLLSFENGDFKDARGNYTVSENTLYPTNDAAMGQYAAFSRGTDGGLIMAGKAGTLFSSEGHTGSFTIDFWIKPSTVENGEILLNWRSSKTVGQKITYQHISFIFNNDRLMCIFSNIFDGYDIDDGDLFIKGDERLIPNKWSHHTISYNQDDGLLMYKVDNTTQDVRYITTNGRESGSIYSAILGTKASVAICPKFTGLIDDFCIQTSKQGNPVDPTMYDEESFTQSHYVTSGGRFETTPILLNAGTTLNRLNAEVSSPAETEVHFFVRSGDNHYRWTSDYPEWHRVDAGQDLRGISGMYFQVACDLYSDGSGKLTPSVSRLDLIYTPLQNPRPPYDVQIARGNNSVTLKWTKSVDKDVAGYYIYYGTKSGEYLGNRALEGLSPINAGDTLSYTLSGLQNGTIYYFAIASISSVNHKITGELSKEVYARPCVDRY